MYPPLISHSQLSGVEHLGPFEVGCCLIDELIEVYLITPDTSDGHCQPDVAHADEEMMTVSEVVTILWR